MDEKILAILKECNGSDFSEDFKDVGSGKLAGRYITSGRPLPGTRGVFNLVRFNEVEVIRNGVDWIVVGMAISAYADHPPKAFSIETNQSISRIKISLNADIWESADPTKIEVVNSASTGKLLVRFKEDMYATNNSRVVMAASSYVIITDS